MLKFKIKFNFFMIFFMILFSSESLLANNESSKNSSSYSHLINNEELNDQLNQCSDLEKNFLKIDFSNESVFELYKAIIKQIEQNDGTIAHVNPLEFYSKNEAGKKVFQYLAIDEAKNLFLRECKGCNKQHLSETDLNIFYDNLEDSSSTQKLQNPKNIRDKFDDREMSDIFEGSKKLDSLVEDGSTLWFLGRSPLWIKEAYNQLINKKYTKVISIPFSGKPGKKNFFPPHANTFKETITPERLKFYEEYLKNIGISPSNINEKVYIIDYLNSGQSLYQFLMLLETIYQNSGKKLPDITLIDISFPDKKFEKYIWANKFTTINNKIIFNSQNRKLSIPYLSLEIPDDTMKSLVYEPDHQSLGYYYPAGKWNSKFNEERDNAHKKIDAIKMQEQLIQYSKNRLEIEMKNED